MAWQIIKVNFFANLSFMNMKKYFLDKEGSLLLIVDIQGTLAESMTYKHQVYRNNKTLIQVARTLEVPILVTEQYPKGLGHTIGKIKAELPEGTKVLEKIHFSACQDNLIKEIEVFDRKQIIVTGMETHVCVFQTVRDLLARGYFVHLPKDALASRYSLNYHNALDLMKEMGAVLTNTETVFFDLLKRADTKEFKALAPLIR